MIQFKIDIAALKAEIAAEIVKQDALSRQVAEQLLIEGKNVAHANVLKDTSALNDSIETASNVERIGPCKFSITWGASMDYATHQEFGPKSGKLVWRFRPFIRPAVAIVQAKFEEIVDRVYNQ